jgi:hypothetical protein
MIIGPRPNLWPTLLMALAQNIFLSKLSKDAIRRGQDKAGEIIRNVNARGSAHGARLAEWMKVNITKG